MKFNPVTSKKLYIQIYNQILSQILSGAFQVGDKLPSERELCEQFEVSRVPVRQALSALELNGYIYSRQGEGVYVNTIEEKKESSVSQILNATTPEDIIEARMNIEPLIVRYAAKRATDQEIEELQRIISIMEVETKEGYYNPETDELLHNQIAKATHNDLFVNFMSTISQTMRQQEMWEFIRDRTVTREDYQRVNFEEHKTIIRAIENHDENEAAQMMTDHMNNLFTRYWKE